MRCFIVIVGIEMFWVKNWHATVFVIVLFIIGTIAFFCLGLLLFGFNFWWVNKWHALGVVDQLRINVIFNIVLTLRKFWVNDWQAFGFIIGISKLFLFFINFEVSNFTSWCISLRD